MSKLVAFIIGAGSNIGESVASLLKEKGYAVAWGSRTPDAEKLKKEGYFPVKVDITEQSSIKAAFASINAELGTPNVVVYNAALHQQPEVPTDPLTLPLDVFNNGLWVGGNVFVAAQEAISGFRSEVHKNNPKAFIVTGNLLPTIKPPQSSWLALDLQKVVEARLVQGFANAYKDAGIQFVYAHLVSETGGIPPYDIFLKSGPVHAKVYWELINRKEGNWDYRFTPEGKQLPDYEQL